MNIGHLRLLIVMLSLYCNILLAAPRTERRAPRPNVPTIIAPVGPLVSCNEEKLHELLELLNYFVVFCCNQNQTNFDTLFIDLNELLNTFTVCCTEIVNDLNGTFTSITEVESTLTACCAALEQDFQGVFSVLNSEFTRTFTEIADITSSLTACCENFQLQFIGTLTSLASIGANLTCTTVCGDIPIMAPITIDVPGVYCLAADITGSIIINVDDVTIDLNNHTINGSGVGTGILINPGSNRIIKNGRIANVATGIVMDSNSNTQLNNIIINGYTLAGVQSNNSNTIFVNSLLMTTQSGVGFNCTGTNDAYIIKQTIVDGGSSGFVFADISDSVIQDCQFIGGSSTGIAFGFAFQGGTANQCNNCTVKNLAGTLLANGFFVDNSAHINLIHCVVQNISSSAGNAQGFMCGPFAVGIECAQCSVLTANGTISGIGFGLEGETITAYECVAQLIDGMGLNGTGFLCTGSLLALTECSAFNCSGTGFIITSSATMLEYCESAYNDTGYVFENESTLIGNSTAFGNNTIGFNLLVPGVAIYHCFASLNNAGTNYVDAPNVQNANTQYDHAAPGLTGPFAGANLFI